VEQPLVQILKWKVQIEKWCESDEISIPNGAKDRLKIAELYGRLGIYCSEN
jgi:hypothetical protein